MASFPPVISQVLIHDPPRQHPAHWESQQYAFTDDIYHYYLLSSLHSGPINLSPLYHLHPPKRDPLSPHQGMVGLKRRRSSLQAILVPSFLFPNAGSNPPSPSPLSETFDAALEVESSPRPASPVLPTPVKQRLRAHSAVGARSPNAVQTSFPAIDVQVAFPTQDEPYDSGALVSPASGPGYDSLSPHRGKERGHTRKRSKTLIELFRPARSSPPPDFLLDDDPFANLTTSPTQITPMKSYDNLRRHGSRTGSISSISTASSSSVPSLGMGTSSSGSSLSSSTSSTVPPLPAQAAGLAHPRSPLNEAPPLLPLVAPKSPKAPQPLPYTLSATRSPSSPNLSLGYPGKSQSITASVPSSPIPHTGSIRATPAHQRPAFKPRPSLPSLNTLARMNVVLTKKVRKGRVGAGLPFEPWDDLPSDDDSMPTTPTAVPARAAPLATGPSPLSPSPASAPEIATSPASSSTSLATPRPTAVDGAASPISHGPADNHTNPSPRPLLPSEIMSLGSAVSSDEFAVVPPKRSTSLVSSTPSQQSSPLPQEIPVIVAPEPRLPLPVIGENIILSEPTLPPPLVVPDSSSATSPVQSESLPVRRVSLSTSSAPSQTALNLPTLPSIRPLSDFAPELPELEVISSADSLDSPSGAVIQEDEVFFPGAQPHIALAENVEPEMVFARPEETGDYVDHFDVDDVLERYHSSSRAASDDGHGQDEVLDKHAEATEASASSDGHRLAWPPLDGSRLSIVHEEASRLSSDGGSSQGADHSYRVVDTSFETSYHSPPPSSESHSSQSHSHYLLAPSSNSMTSEYGSPPSSSSISRSASFRSYESGMSSDSGSVFRRRRHSDLYDDEEAIEERLSELFEEDAEAEAKSMHSGNRSFRSFGALHGYISASMSNPSLSSLDLDLGGESEENVMGTESVASHEGDCGAPHYPTQTLLLQRDDLGGTSSAASSCGRPSLSRTRSSEDDAESDMVHSPTGTSFNEFAYPPPRIHESRFSLRQSLTSSSGSRLQEDQKRRLQLQLDPPLMSMSMAAVGMISDPQQALDSEDGVTGEHGVHEVKGFGFGFDQVTTEPAAVDGTGTRAGGRGEDVVALEDERKAIAADDEIDAGSVTVDAADSLTRDTRTSMKEVESEGNNVIDTDMTRLSLAGEVPTNTTAPGQASLAYSSTLPSPTASTFSPPPSSVVSSVSSPNPPCSPQYSQTEFSQPDLTMGTAIARVMGHAQSVHSSVFFSDDEDALLNGEVTQFGAGGMPGSWTHSSRAGSTSYTSSGAAVYRNGSSSAGYQGAYSSINSRGYSQRRGGSRGNGDDEEDDEERRRRQFLANMGHRADEPDAGSRSRSGSVARSATTSRSRASSRSANVPSVPPTPALPRAALAQPSTRFPGASASSSRYVSEEEEESEENSSSSDDDDVPLAQRIPGALKAQKTIRRQVREEREQRKRERAVRNEERRQRQETLRPSGAAVGSRVDGAQGVSSSHEAAVAAAAAVASASASASWTSSPHGRQRTFTMPSNQSVPAQGVSPHDLSRKLQNIQLGSPPAHRQYLAQQQQQFVQKADPTPLRAKSVSRPSGEYPRSQDAAYPISPVSPAIRSRSVRHPPTFSPTTATSDVPPVPRLRPSRSFHRPSDADRMPPMEPPMPTPVDAEQRVSRSNTRASAREAPPRRSLSTRRPSTSDRPAMPSEPVPPMPIRPSMDNPRKLHKPHPPAESHAPSARTSCEADQPNTLSARQPGQMATKSHALVQQRVFVANLQQFHMMEIGPNTTAGDVVAMLDSEGALTGWAGSGGWMVFEVAQDFGMERPVRSFELLADVQASWLKDKTVNYFILKLTPLAIPLSRNAIPSSSPVHSGYVEWEAKRGKWSKRWLQLREHSLWLSKRDNGKDEVMLCSLSTFDTYQVTRANRSPKPFTFSVKSTDNLSFFENTADYMHTFSCSEKDGKVWMEKILVARSYVLHQERQVLFASKPPAGHASSSHAPSGATVVRAGTRKNSSTAQRPTQPLVSLPPMYVTAQNNIHTDVFEPGSLLSKQF